MVTNYFYRCKATEMLAYPLKAGESSPLALLIKHHINSDEEDENISQSFLAY
jgi:hypothetical protein